MLKITSFLLAILQFIGVSLAIVPIDTELSYGGTERPVVCTQSPVVFIENGKSDYRIVISQTATEIEKTAAKGLK